MKIHTFPFLEAVKEKPERRLHVMKFGGTSVGDATCMRKVVDIVREAARESKVLVVVSAMSGVTNLFIEAATESAAGNRERATTILEQLRKQHEMALQDLLLSHRDEIVLRMQDLLALGAQWCNLAASTGLTARLRDAISSLGERLSAPLLAAALAEQGMGSEAIESSELLITDSEFGRAEPIMEFTRERCEARLRPLLEKGIVPVVTGFMGATVKAELTTLGRGGSDYSATILGAALAADKVTIWTDVEGILTADPRLVPDAATIPSISYREATELAYFGAKVLHPKTLRPVMQSGIPVWIRNTFAPDRAGTKITPDGHERAEGVNALTAVSDAALITLGAPAIDRIPHVFERTLAAAGSARADVLMMCHSHACNRICLVVASAAAQATVEALRREFASHPDASDPHHVTVDPSVAILTVVGQDLHHINGIVGRAVDELSRENVRILATAPGSSKCNVSFVVQRKDLHTALITTHREFQPCPIDLPAESRTEAIL